jgi:hypothetical protein
MWQQFLALPPVARVISLAVVFFLALWAFVKAKAIHAAWEKTTDTGQRWFWGWLAKKINAGHHNSGSNESTREHLKITGSLHTGRGRYTFVRLQTMEFLPQFPFGARHSSQLSNAEIWSR